MFFHKRIKSIQAQDKVLEIGPGAAPHPRSDVLLEIGYVSDKERIAQSGHVGLLQTNKKIIYYNGGTFPFADKEFDYAICSHVLEHVEDPDVFIGELTRVAHKGYLEFPTIYYDYLYDFDEHVNFVFYTGSQINWLKKEDAPLEAFRPVTEFLYKTAQHKYWDYVDSLKEFFFQGFEWFESLPSQRVEEIKELCYDSKMTSIPVRPSPSSQKLPFMKRIRKASSVLLHGE